jgi:hypothetical protein
LRISVIILLIFFLSANISVAQKELNLNKKLSFSRIDIPLDHSFLNFNNMVHSLVEGEDGIIWIATPYGLYKYNGNALIDVLTIVKNDFPEIIQDLRIRSITIDKSGQLWLGTYKGIFILNEKKYTLKRFLIDKQNNDYRKNKCWGIKHHKGIIYYLSENGLWLIDHNTETVVDSFLVEEGDNTLQHSLSFELMPDYLIGAYVRGVFKINMKSKEVEVFQYDEVIKRSEPFHHFFYDGTIIDSVYWMPTYGFAMVSFDLRSNKFDHYFINEPVQDKNLIKNLIKYNDSLLIVNVTGTGVGTFNIKSKEYNFHSDKEKQNWFLRYADQPFLKDKNGRLYVADFTRIFKSDEIVFENSNTANYEIDFYGFESDNGSLKDFNHESISLKKSEELLKFNYTVINVLDPKRIRYQYKLEGLNNEWINNGNSTNFIQTNLKKSKYTLTLQAFKEDQLLAERQLHIYKELFFYQKLWFKITSVLAIGLVIFALLMNRMKRIKDRALLEKTYNKKLSEIEMNALRAQMNPHFLFNSLNSIKYYALNKGPEETADYISKFSLLVRRILNNSKTKTISLASEIDTLKLYCEIEQLRFEKGFDFNLSIDDKLEINEIEIPPMLVQPFLENAIWHGLMHKDDKGILGLTMLGEKSALKIIVDDNGIGRAKAMELQKSKYNTKFKSLGMKITTDRLKLIEENTGVKSEIIVIDKVDKQSEACGTKVILTLHNAIN